MEKNELDEIIKAFDYLKKRIEIIEKKLAIIYEEKKDREIRDAEVHQKLWELGGKKMC